MSHSQECTKDENFNKLSDTVPMNCPICGAQAELWERTYSKLGDTIATKAVMCSNQIGYAGLDCCLLYLPPEAFYKATKREAQAFWNQFVIDVVHMP